MLEMKMKTGLMFGILAFVGGAWAGQPLGIGEAAPGMWSYVQRGTDGKETALVACMLNDGAVKGFSAAGTAYPFVVKAETAVKDLQKFSVPLEPGKLAVHPAPNGAVVLRFKVAEAGDWTVDVKLTDLKTGGSPNDVGVNGVLMVDGHVSAKLFASVEKGKPTASHRIRRIALKAGAYVELAIDSNDGYACDGTEVLFDVRTWAPTPGVVQVPGSWKWMPPADVDPKLADTPDPRTRKWSGQKASLRFSEVTMTGGVVKVDWCEAASATNAPFLRGHSKSLWQGRFPDHPSISEPTFLWVGRDLRLFRGAAPDAAVLLPLCVVTDGNLEDGFGGYMIGIEGASPADRPVFEVKYGPAFVALEGDGRAFVRRFDGTWLAGLQLAAREHPQWFAPPAGLSAKAKAEAEAMSADLFASVVSEWVQDAGRWGCPARGWSAFLDRRLVARADLLADPRLTKTLESGLSFITRRPPTWNHEVAQYFGWRQDPGGSIYVLRRPGRSLETRDLIAGRLPSGSFLQPRLSYDAKKILFSFVATEGALDPYEVVKVNEEDGDHHYYHLWEINVDGTGLRQLTKGVYEDFMPEFLPDGDIAFMTSRRRSQSRCFWFGYSNRWQAYTMFRMHPDGTGMQQLSWNDVAEWFPTMSNDGEILFARWDYIDRDAVRHQNLWKMRPDGTNPMQVWGNEVFQPHCTFQPRAIPGSRKIVCIAAAHHSVTGGPVILVDPTGDENDESSITHVTPGHYPENDMPTTPAPVKDEGTVQDHARDNDWYASPYPYGEDLFLVAWSRDDLKYEPSRRNPNDALGLYMLAADGRRELLWRDGNLSAECPEPLLPRPVPPKWIPQVDETLAKSVEGEVFISDIYRGLKHAAPGTLKQVRVVQIYPRTAPDQYLPNTGCGGHENARGVIGLANVESDGSARFIVPAKVPLLFQVLDAKSQAWRTMRSTTSLMPGERVSCVGCHEPKREAGAHTATVSEAMKKPAQKLVVPPEGGRPWGFVENVQPIFDKKCVSCHSGDQAPRGVVLTREADTRFSDGTNVVFRGYRQYSAPWTKSYATLCFTDELTRAGQTGRHNRDKKFQWYKYRMYTDKKTGEQLCMVPNWPEYNHVQTTPEGMEGRSSLSSGLMRKLSKGKHGAMLTDEERRLIASWIDLNATFYGSYLEPDLSKQFRGEPIVKPEIP